MIWYYIIYDTIYHIILYDMILYDIIIIITSPGPSIILIIIIVIVIIYMYTYLLYMAINVCYGLQNLDQLVIPVSWSLGRRRPRTSQGTAGAACAASKAREDFVGTGGQKRW